MNYNKYIIEEIDINDIIENPENFFVMDDESIKLLADDIKEHGLFVSPIVVPIENHKYMLLSGHRRYRAIKYNIERGDKSYLTVPCRVVEDYDDKQEMIALINTNIMQRTLTTEEKIIAVQKLVEIMPEFKKATNEKGRTVELIAKMLHINPRTVANYKKIGDNISPDALALANNKDVRKQDLMEVISQDKSKQKASLEKIIEKKQTKRELSEDDYLEDDDSEEINETDLDQLDEILKKPKEEEKIKMQGFRDAEKSLQDSLNYLKRQKEIILDKDIADITAILNNCENIISEMKKFLDEAQF